MSDSQNNAKDLGLPPELASLINEFEVWDNSTRRRAESRNKVRLSLHHYTDMGALVGIVQNSQLWLTSVFHMNDPTELVFGLGLAIERLRWHLEQNPGTVTVADAIKDSFCDRMLDVLSDDIATAFGFYVGSFSRTRDDLGQWRSYSDDGRGVAIEVSPSWFAPTKQADLPIQERYFVSGVEYNVTKSRKKQRDAIDRAVRIVSTAATQNLLNVTEVRNRFLSELRIRLAVPLLWNSVTSKHPAYKHEKETRLILLNDTGNLASVVRTRTRGSQIVSYVPINFPIKRQDVLRHVLIGPAAIGAAETGVENLLRANELDPKGLVSRSEVPYRPR